MGFTLGLAAGAQERTPRERFGRAVELAAEGDYRTALHEFRAVYELTRNPEVLFNIAAAHEQLNQYAEALEAVERFERLAPPAAVQRHREDLAGAMMRLASRVGSVLLTVTPPEARCTVDGAERPRDALSAGLRVSIGPRAVRCEAPSFVAQERVVDVAPGTPTRVSFASRARRRG